MGSASLFSSVLVFTLYSYKSLEGAILNNCGLLSNADAPTFSPTYGSKVISKPHEEEQPFSEFLDHVIRQETDPAFPRDAEVRYAQTRQPTLSFSTCRCRPLLTRMARPQKTTISVMSMCHSFPMLKKTSRLRV